MYFCQSFFLVWNAQLFWLIHTRARVIFTQKASENRVAERGIEGENWSFHFRNLRRAQRFTCSAPLIFGTFDFTRACSQVNGAGNNKVSWIPNPYFLATTPLAFLP